MKFIEFLNEDNDLLHLDDATRKILSDKMALPSQLDRLADSSDNNVLIRVAEHPNTSEETLFKLLYKDIHAVNTAIANNANATYKMLDNILEMTNNVYALTAIAKHKNVSIEALRELAYHKNPFVREAVVNNPKTPTQYIKNMQVSKYNDDRLNRLIQNRLK